MKLLVLSLMLISSVNAQDICYPSQNIAEERMIMPREPEYFFKPIPVQDSDDPRHEVSVIMDNSNWIIDMKDPSNVTQIPGPYDGVPSPDGRFLAMPSEEGGLVFYDRDNLSRENSRKLLDDDSNGRNKLYGVYHSIGKLSSSPNGDASYRLITDTITNRGQTAMSQLYYKDFSTKTVDGDISFEQNPQPAKHLCSNMMNRYFKLPMISKDGRQLAAYDVESGTTKIFSIESVNGESVCNQTRDLGFAAGKVEFSPDGKKITFAMDSHPTDPQAVEWYAQPPESKNYNVYMVDLENDTMSRVSTNNQGNSYYPSFWFDGSIVYLNQSENEEGETEYSVIRTKFSNAPTVSLPKPQNLSCGNVSQDFLALSALGSLWGELCLSMDKPVTLTGLAMLPLALNTDKCREMVEENWDKFSSGRNHRSILQRLQSDRQNENVGALRERLYEGYMSLSKSDLINACPQTKNNTNGTTLTAAQVETKVDPNENPMILCQQCHTAAAGSRHFDFSNPASLAPHKAKMLTHVMTGFMPRNTPISQERRDRILEWIDKNIPGEATLPDFENDSN